MACASGNLEDSLADTAKIKGVSGYVYHTVPVAVAAWYIHFGDCRSTVESVIMLGGDTDTVAAIAGSLSGILVCRSGIPEEWLNGIIDSPHNPTFIGKLANALGRGSQDYSNFAWGLFPRGFVFSGIVLFHGFRRLLLPWL